MSPNIIVFGTKNCRFCTKQLEYLKATYGEQSKNWVFIDVASNNDMMKIAREAKVETIPSVVVLNKKNQIILQRKGTISPDEIFFRQSLHKESGISLPFAFVPFTDEEVSYLLNGNKTYGLFSSSFNLKEGITAEAHRYNSTLDNKEKICNLHITKLQKTNLEQVQLEYTKREVDDYLFKGGNKNSIWIIKFERKK